MSIDKGQSVVAFDEANLPVLRQIIDKIQTDAVTVRYASASPTKMSFNEVVVVDDGSSLTRLYIKSGQKRLLYVALTA